MAQRYISADDIAHLFYRKPKKTYRLLSWPTVSAAFLIVVGIFLLINAPAFSQQLAYWWSNDYQTPAVISQPTGQSPVSLPVVQPARSLPTSQFNPDLMANNTIAIPKIKVSAPVIWDVTSGSDVNTDLLKALQQGVARYPQTALPNQIGNTFLTGHSSNYWWDPGHYKTIFALLDKLVAGDTIYIKYQNQVYTYHVTGQQVVPPTDTAVLDPTNQPILSLMTCTPTGTSLNRRIVTAALVSPTTNLVAQPTRPTENVLQSVR